jgi:glycine/D-amino acid oxidase-like deaminating enzyme
VAALSARGVGVVTGGDRQGIVVHATGHAGLAGPPPLGRGVRGQAALLACDARDRPQIHAGGFHIVPHGDGTTAVGSTTEAEWDDPAATDARLEGVIARARAICPALAAAPVILCWAGIRPRAESGQPLLGPHPHHPGQFIANGGFKTGFALAPLAAEVMADLILEGRDRIPDAFRPA